VKELGRKGGKGKERTEGGRQAKMKGMQLNFEACTSEISYNGGVPSGDNRNHILTSLETYIS
jgi:hypothetical protein